MTPRKNIPRNAKKGTIIDNDKEKSVTSKGKELTTKDVQRGVDVQSTIELINSLGKELHRIWFGVERLRHLYY